MLLVNVSGLAGNLHNARLASSVAQRSHINCTYAADNFLKQKTKDSDRSKLGDCQKKRGRLRPDDEPNLSRHNVRLVGQTKDALLDTKLETKKNDINEVFFSFAVGVHHCVCVLKSTN
jgi:hypothetical protein